MADQLPDLYTPLPDRAHEALRQATVDALEQVKDSFLLLLATAGGLQGSLNVAQSGQAAIAQMQTAVTALGQQVQALSVRLDADKIRDDMNTDSIDALQVQVAELTARVEALENGGV